jgi:2-polyprenyl-3-methyl-5-hydroxy-6-metoxy-1,4-benzoquinol methylase
MTGFLDSETEARLRQYAAATGYDSGNLRKHFNRNPAQRRLISGFLRNVGDLVETARPRRVVDVGCGEGFIARYLQDRFSGLEVHGIDLSVGALGAVRTVNPDARVICGSALELPCKSASYDLVLCSEVLEHLEEPADALVELKRVARQHCVLSVPNEPWMRLMNLCRGRDILRLGNHPEHIQNWSSSAFSTLVARHMRVKSVRTSLPWTIVLASTA